MCDPRENRCRPHEHDAGRSFVPSPGVSLVAMSLTEVRTISTALIDEINLVRPSFRKMVASWFVLGANTETRSGMSERAEAAGVLTQRTQELADANTELRSGLDDREKVAGVLTQRTQELADANTELRSGLFAREKAAGGAHPADPGTRRR